jgi:hypothetical protein
VLIAVEGFAPTPEMPKIVEVQALVARLAETDKMKAATAQWGAARSP